MKAAHTMMSTSNSSLTSLNNGKIGNPMPQVQPPTAQAQAQAQSKRFAQIMAKAQTSAPPAAPPAPVKPTTPVNTAPTEASNEASRAEANARSNAKTAARALATRALVKAPASEVNQHFELRSSASDHAPSDDNEASNESSGSAAALSADMAAWVAALNPTSVQSTTIASARTAGETAMAEAGLASQLATQTADKNAQVLRKETDAEDSRAQRSLASQRAATDLSGARFGHDGAGSDGAAQSGRDGQRDDTRGTREALEARAAARTQTELPATFATDLMTSLSKELAGSGATGATSAKGAANLTDFSALMASSMSNANAANGAADTPTLSLPTAVNAPEFREALGVQVSLLARDGVQTAELHLNPADMGPVSIQIVMDGTLARVDFGADVAATRAAIEASMPELASALSDAGFTLAGGGVSQHAKGQGQGQGQSQAPGDNRQSTTRRNAVASTVAIPSAQALQRRVQLTPGGIDLFA
jgi:flagellar hook-length control protein FliK